MQTSGQHVPEASAQTSPYRGRSVALATMHGKEAAIAEPFARMLDLAVVVPETLNTDLLGTFTGEVERPGDMRATARQKALLGMQASGHALGVASEGAYGPHPVLPFIPSGTELMLFIDEERSIEIVEVMMVKKTNFGSTATQSLADISKFMKKSGFPEHALIVSPNVPPADAEPAFRKGIRELELLDAAVAEMAERSEDGRALVQTDMRAHVNPTRQSAIQDLAAKLASRLLCYCPACNTPGFGVSSVEHGLPCELCRLPTKLALHEIHQCPACSYEHASPRPDGLTEADAQYCDRCNP